MLPTPCTTDHPNWIAQQRSADAACANARAAFLRGKRGLIHRFSPLKVELCRGTGEWRLLEPLKWIDPAGFEHLVPRDFLTDFASVPRLMRPFAMDDAVSAGPATLHDFAYRVTRPGRRWADDLFFHALRSNGAGPLAAWSYWLAVRLFGWIAYRKAKR